MALLPSDGQIYISRSIWICYQDILPTSRCRHEPSPNTSWRLRSVFHEIFAAGCNTPYTNFLSFGIQASHSLRRLSSDVRIRTSTREAYSRFCNWSIDISHHAPSQFDASLPISISDCEHRPDTSSPPGSSAPSPAIHGPQRISIGWDATNSRTRRIDSDHLSGPRSVAKAAMSNERRERRMGTSAPF